MVLHRQGRLRRAAAADALEGPGHVRGAVEGDPFGGGAVAAGAADLLPVGLDRARGVGVDDEADVGLVDAHAEGDGGDHHRFVLVEEPVEAVAAERLVEPGVIGARREAVAGEALGQLLGALARAGVDDAGPPLARRGQGGDAVLAATGLPLRRERQLGPGEAGDEGRGLAQAQLRADVLARAGVGGGGDRQPGHAGKDLRQAAEVAVLGPEVVAPLADAMGLVDGDEAKRRGAQPLEGPGLQEPLGREVDQVEPAGRQAPPGGVAVLGAEPGIHPRGRHPQLPQRLHLVAHQGDQRRDHQADAGPQHSGDLVADALAAAGRQHRQGVAAGENLADHLALQAPEVGVAEGPAQDVARVV